MSTSVSREKLMFYAVAGGLGGFAAWGAAEPFLGIRSVYGRDILLGALIGLFIAVFLASIEALSVDQWSQAVRGTSSGAIFGIIGGAAGLLVGEYAFDLVGGVLGRIIGWSLLGLMVGLGAGWATRSNARRRNGAIGGIIGGALGGFTYWILTTIFPQEFGRAIAIIVLGMLIGFFIGLVGELLKRGWLMVVRSQSRNAREGREYPLIKPVTTVGRAEENDVGLFGDRNIMPQHLLIRREGRKFVVSAASGGQVLINRQPLAGRQVLKSGDRIEVGGTLFLFRDRAQATTS